MTSTAIPPKGLPAPSLGDGFARLDAFQANLRFTDLPPTVVLEASRCLVDLIGVAAAGRTTRNGKILAEHAAENFGVGVGMRAAHLAFDGRPVSPVGAAMAGAGTIDSLDAHDGHRLAKGHAGVVLLPSLIAALETAGSLSGEQFLTRLVIGYEIAIRCAIALHASAPDYHSSGAWNALGAVAALACPLGLSSTQLREALGTAEYYGPRSQMMRCIDFPTMVKDGATMGAEVALSAALLARRGFTGAPALTIEAPEHAPLWQDLGTRWLMLEQYLKPWPVCRWAQPAIAAAAALYPAIGNAQIKTAEITTFHQAARLAARAPQTSEAAQYSLPFPVAAMLTYGEVNAASVTTRLADPPILALSSRIGIAENDACNAAFPAKRLARLTLELTDGRCLETGFIEASGDPETRLDRNAVSTKFQNLTDGLLSPLRQQYLLQTTWNLQTIPDLSEWLEALLAPLEIQME